MIGLRIIFFASLVTVITFSSMFAMNDLSNQQCCNETKQYSIQRQTLIEHIKGYMPTQFSHFVSEQSNNAYNAIKNYNFRRIPSLFVEYGGGAHVAHILAQPANSEQLQKFSDFFNKYEITTSYVVASLEIFAFILLLRMVR